MSEVKTSKTRIRKGALKCATWLAYCLSIGYKKSELPDLEKLWRKYRDRNGNLKTNNT